MLSPPTTLNLQTRSGRTGKFFAVSLPISYLYGLLDFSTQDLAIMPDKGEGVKNPKNFVDVLCEWSLTKVVLNLVLGISQKCVQGRGEGANNNSAYMLIDWKLTK